ncbi:MAG: hypothetical protein JXR83_01280 [Deltaproteobacteria bacterium]|nr:hypothetical protein [Deltaproteobacteria bacterium]
MTAPKWISASKLRNFLLDDPIVDWLERFGESCGYVPDPLDVRADFGTFIMRKGREFEERLLPLVEARLGPVQRVVGDGPRGYRPEYVAATLDAMKQGKPLIYQGMVADPASHTCGLPDLLVRSDHLNNLVPGSIDAAQARISTPMLPGCAFHYVVVDIKFSRLHFNKNWQMKNTGSALAFKAQVLVYNRALAAMQGLRPDHAYLLGRASEQSYTENKEPVVNRNDGCLARLAAISTDDPELWQQVDAAVAWLRRLDEQGAQWVAEPAPSVHELRPNMKAADSRWRQAKKKIAATTGELTCLWQVGVAKRNQALADGVLRGDQPDLSAAQLGVTGASTGDRLDALLDIERASAAVVVTPPRITWNEDAWRNSRLVEFFVDFETVSDLDDDFSKLPTTGGRPMIFQIGCLHVEDGEIVFEQWTADRLTADEERRVVGAWLDHMQTVKRRLDPDGPPVRVVHWSPAEDSFLSTAYNAFYQRNPAITRTPIDLFDFLGEVVKPKGAMSDTIAVRGARGFGLKRVAKAMHQHGLIAAEWGDSVTDGLGAMAAAWSCDAEARKKGTKLPDFELMREVAAYNKIDCVAMYEVVNWLRKNR